MYADAQSQCVWVSTFRANLGFRDQSHERQTFYVEAQVPSARTAEPKPIISKSQCPITMRLGFDGFSFSVNLSCLV